MLFSLENAAILHTLRPKSQVGQWGCNYSQQMQNILKMSLPCGNFDEDMV